MSRAYLFGDSAGAIRRLELLHEVFRPATRAFLSDTVLDPPRLAIDLGCGPGLTTRLLADLTGADRVVGLEFSERMLDLARPRETPRIGFYQHDVTVVPFPERPADLVFCRFLLTHLPDPAAAVDRWAGEIRPGGRLLLEEVETIETTEPVFRRYLDCLEDLLQQQSNTLYVGTQLDALPDTPRLRRRTSTLRPMPVATADAAALFTLNLANWRHSPYLLERYGAAEFDAIERELTALTGRVDRSSAISWGLRQIVFERV